MIVAASATLLAESRACRRGAGLPWALLVAGSVASLAANVAVAESTLTGRVIAAWPYGTRCPGRAAGMDLPRPVSCSVRRGGGRRTTGPLMERFRLEARSCASMVGTNAGAGSSRAQDWQASSRTSLPTKRQAT
jgi:hypothetical protein